VDVTEKFANWGFQFHFEDLARSWTATIVIVWVNWPRSRKEKDERWPKYATDRFTHLMCAKTIYIFSLMFSVLRAPVKRLVKMKGERGTLKKKYDFACHIVIVKENYSNRRELLLRLKPISFLNIFRKKKLKCVPFVI
jgi:hypothetical protein